MSKKKKNPITPSTNNAETANTVNLDNNDDDSPKQSFFSWIISLLPWRTALGVVSFLLVLGTFPASWPVLALGVIVDSLFIIILRSDWKNEENEKKKAGIKTWLEVKVIRYEKWFTEFKEKSPLQGFIIDMVKSTVIKPFISIFKFLTPGEGVMKFIYAFGITCMVSTLFMAFVTTAVPFTLVFSGAFVISACLFTKKDDELFKYIEGLAEKLGDKFFGYEEPSQGGSPSQEVGPSQGEGRDQEEGGPRRRPKPTTVHPSAPPAPCSSVKNNTTYNSTSVSPVNQGASTSRVK